MTYSYFADSVYLFGSRDASGLRNDFWRFDMATLRWTQVNAAPAPTVREHAELVEGYAGYVMLFGGVDGRGRALHGVHDYLAATIRGPRAAR